MKVLRNLNDYSRNQRKFSDYTQVDLGSNYENGKQQFRPFVSQRKHGSNVRILTFNMKERVVIKQLSRKSNKFYQTEEHFMNLLSHKNLPQIIKDIPSNDGCFVMMKYHGQTLAEWVSSNCREQRIPVIQHICNQLLSVLNYLHSNNVIHGDISPKNILIDSSNHVTLIDYGSMICAPCGHDFEPVNTIGFSSPESCLHNLKTYSFAHDIYAVAILILYMYTGNIYYAVDYSNYSKSNQICMSDVVKYMQHIEILQNVVSNIPVLSIIEDDTLYREFMIPMYWKTMLCKMISFNPLLRPSANVILNTIF